VIDRLLGEDVGLNAETPGVRGWSMILDDEMCRRISARLQRLVISRACSGDGGDGRCSISLGDVPRLRRRRVIGRISFVLLPKTNPFKHIYVTFKREQQATAFLFFCNKSVNEK